MQLKCVVAGPSGAGKTCALITHTSSSFPADYIPTLCHDFQMSGFITPETAYTITYWDIQGGVDYAKYRILAYPHTDVFMLLFDVSTGVDNVEQTLSFWLQEITKNSSSLDVPIVLAGSKTDLRNCSGVATASFDDGARLAKKLNLKKYLEFSSLNNVGLEELFAEVVEIGYQYRRNQRKVKRTCTLL